MGKWIEGEERLGKVRESHRISWNTMEGHGITLDFLERRTLEGSGKFMWENGNS